MAVGRLHALLLTLLYLHVGAVCRHELVPRLFSPVRAWRMEGYAYVCTQGLPPATEGVGNDSDEWHKYT